MRLPLALAVVSLVGVSTQAQERPLPDAQAFLKEARQRLQTDEQRQSSFVYLETRRDLKLDGAGKTTQETVKVFESYPGLPGERRWRRLLSVDGKPVSQAELDEQDRERQKKAEEWVRKLERETEQDRRARARERAKERRENDAVLDDVFRVFEFELLGRDTVDGHDTIVWSITPRQASRPQTREGKIIKHFAGKAWVSESEYELVRLELEALDTVSVGFGLVARIHEGSRAAFQRRKVNGEAWLPASARYTASGRLLLVRRLRVAADSEFSNYRKFTVETDTTIARPK
ncbi:MAG: hypothetical protein ACT4QD_09540 [Acidobacteriota bacterium]